MRVDNLPMARSNIYIPIPLVGSVARTDPLYGNRRALFQFRKVQELLRVAKFAASQFAVSLSRSSLDLLYMCVRPLMLRPTGLHPDLLR